MMDRAFSLLTILTLCVLPHAASARPAPHMQGRSLQQTFTMVPEPLKVPWTPLLTEEEIRRGMFFGSGQRLHQLAKKLMAGRPIRVIMLGGSVTNSDLMEQQGLSFAALFEKFVRANFPNKLHKFENQGIPSSNSGWFASCIEYLVGANADLVTVEFAVNDMRNAPDNSFQRRTYEQLLRRVLRQPGAPAVILLNHYSWTLSGGDGVQKGLFYGGPETVFMELAQYYDVPSMSLKAAAWRQMKNNVDGFRVDKTAASSAAPNSLSFVYADEVHPAAAGHKILAELLCAPVIRAVWEAGSTLKLTTRQDRRLAALPPPMIPSLKDSGSSGWCRVQRGFEQAAVEKSGFGFQAEKPSGTTMKRQMWGYVGSKPGDYLILQADTRSGIAGDTRRAQLLLMYLSGAGQSGYGTADISCIEGCTCSGIRLDGTWTKQAVMNTVLPFEVTQHPACRIRVMVTGQNKRVHIGGLFVNF